MVTTRDTKITPLPLESGDRLTRQEFETRYARMPEVKKAELVEGVVYLASPVHLKKHGQPHYDIITWLGVYTALTPGITGSDNTTVRLDSDNEPQPDVLLRIEESKGGQSRVSKDDYVEGAPELVVEIAGSSASYDLHDKKEAYRRNGVQEYIVWQASSQSIIWFSLQENDYVILGADDDGVLRSQIFPGLWLSVNSFVAGELSQVLEVLQEGINSKEHQAFVSKLNSR